MIEQIQVNINEKSYKVKKNVKIADLLNALKYDKSVIAVKVNNIVKSLDDILRENCKIELIKYNDHIGNKMYINND